MLALAAVSMSLVSCSSETTEEIQNEPSTRLPQTDAYITGASENNLVCTQCENWCSLIEDGIATPAAVRETNGMHHYHCDQPGCNYVGQALMNAEEYNQHLWNVHHIDAHSGGRGEGRN